jgi:dipeptidyl aminopeptidase/acylaminoacyl peptidase
MSQIAPFGAWRSPITSELVAQGKLRLHDLAVCDGDLYWAEDRPEEGGRCVISKLDRTGSIREVTPDSFDARSRVHEYGGGAWVVHDGVVFASDFADQRLYRIAKDQPPVPITAAPQLPGGLRYADATVSPDGSWLVCVLESHEDTEVRNELIAIDLKSPVPVRALDWQTLGSGRDFYASPRFSPDGRQLAWLEWDHPLMPWDGTELTVAGFRDGTLADGPEDGPQAVAGGREESIFQPEWSPDGELHFVSDRTGWWNLYVQRGSEAIPLAPAQAEFGTTAWAFGLRTYTFLAHGRIACLYASGPAESLGIIEPGAGEVTALDLPFTAFSPRLQTLGEQIVCIAGCPAQPPTLTLVNPADASTRPIRSSYSPGVDPGFFSVPGQIEFPTSDGERAYALYYPPANPGFTGPDGERPPLIVFSHGGPTASVINQLDLGIQFFTSRGFGVADVDFRGSSGRGRAFRQRLNGSWGLMDAEDCAAAANQLAAQGLVDRTRMAIRGGSSGGYTALRALILSEEFAAGTSIYGITDLEELGKHTHKFESHYLFTLVGTEESGTHRERSPIHQPERICRPVLILQGLLDKVVPPEQAKAMIAVFEARCSPYAYLAFEREAHGFREAGSITRAIEAELYFYSRVFGITLADPVEPITIHHLDGS